MTFKKCGNLKELEILETLENKIFCSLYKIAKFIHNIANTPKNYLMSITF